MIVDAVKKCLLQNTEQMIEHKLECHLNQFSHTKKTKVLHSCK